MWAWIWKLAQTIEQESTINEEEGWVRGAPQ
jgi:hypothetical protein